MSNLKEKGSVGWNKSESFQDRVQPWMMECFGPMISADKVERNHRFLEESLELVQSLGCTRAEAIQLVDYVFGREVGDPPQEVGGVRVTLAALCLAAGLDQDECAEVELARIWTKVPQIRAKQAGKPKYSPLPQHVDPGLGELPPLHWEGYYTLRGGTKWYWCRVVAHDQGKAVIRTKKGNYHARCPHAYQFSKEPGDWHD